MLVHDEDDLCCILDQAVSLDSVVTRVCARYHQGVTSAWVGRVLLCLKHTSPSSQQHIDRVVGNALENIFCTGQPQSIVITGVSGAGKGSTALTVLRRLYNMLGTSQVANYQHLSAAITVIDALGTAGTRHTLQSSRIVSNISIHDGGNETMKGQLKLPPMNCKVMKVYGNAHMFSSETLYYCRASILKFLYLGVLREEQESTVTSCQREGLQNQFLEKQIIRYSTLLWQG